MADLKRCRLAVACTFAVRRATQSVSLFPPWTQGGSSDPTGCSQREQQRHGTLRILVLFKRYVEDEADLAWRSDTHPPAAGRF